MNYKEPGYFERYNQILGQHCDWQVELFTSAHDNEDSLRVFRMHSEGAAGMERVFMGCIPPETPVGSLICCGSLCRHYFQMGLHKAANPPG